MLTEMMTRTENFAARQSGTSGDRTIAAGYASEDGDIMETRHTRFDADASGMELTAGDLFDALYERVAEVKTRALMGEIEQAYTLFQSVAREYAQYADVFAGLPGQLSLEHDLEATRQMLCPNSSQPERRDVLPELTSLPTAPSLAEPKQRVRRRASKAA